MIAHLTEEQLNDYVDGALRAAERERAERHLARCAACAAEVRQLRALLARAEALPTSVEPPEDLWPRIAAARRGNLTRSGAAPDDTGHGQVVPIAPALRRRRPVWVSRAALAAAALVLVALSSALTALLVSRSDRPQVVVRVDERAPVAASAAVFAGAESEYRRAAEELQATLRARRERLSPETIAAVERSLATIDRAIREAREALAQDPGNATLVEILSASYEQKVDLLRRATELLPRS